MKKYKWISLFLIALFAYWLYANKKLTETFLTLHSSKLPKSFQNFQIAHISDLHNTDLGHQHQSILQSLQNHQPDIIVFSGDTLDARRTDVDTAMSLIEQASEIAPVYLVLGNHEARIDINEFLSRIDQSQAVLLNNEKVLLQRNQDSIALIGVLDPAFSRKSNEQVMKEQLSSLSDSSMFQILISHRPELFDIYCQYDIDITLSGHAHGGQVRLPFIGGLFAPNQGIFPQYDSGLYRQDQSQLIVSRGIGNSAFPLRIFNDPEIIYVTLQK